AMDAVRMVVEGDKHGKVDAVLLATQDYDFAPAVKLLQRWGAPVINLGFQHGGNRLADVCDALVTVQELGEAVIMRRLA
ncbi:MAG TPA: NYN domain-containing protein, partial [Holophaga sp.]|nr:NYN domain-containing protein [Holophaga sp.]